MSKNLKFSSDHPTYEFVANLKPKSQSQNFMKKYKTYFGISRKSKNSTFSIENDIQIYLFFHIVRVDSGIFTNSKCSSNHPKYEFAQFL